MRRIRPGLTTVGAALRLAALVTVAITAGCADGGPPVPRPPVPTPLASDATPDDSPSPSVSGTSAAASRFTFPVQAANASYHRTHAVYPGADIFAACGTPVVAVTSGVILEVSRVDRFDKRGPRGPFNGGKFVSLRGDDGVRYYGSHLAEVAPGIEAGVRVRAGELIGTVGRTGNASNVCHLHFGISPLCPAADGWWIRRGVVWPAPYLDAWRKGLNKSAAEEVFAWQRGHGCPKPPRSTTVR